MKVLVIRSYEQAKSGMGQTILEMPDDVTEEMSNDYFVAWLRQRSSLYEDKSKDECLSAEYGWEIDFTESPPLWISKEEEAEIEARRKEKLALEAEQKAKIAFEVAQQRLEEA